MRFGKIDDLSSRVAAAIGGACNYLFSQQHEEGYWCGELEADTTLESDYILLHTLLGTGDRERFQKAARYILQHQNDDGGWGIYAAGPSNVSASVKAYFGLKLAGYKFDHPALVRARNKILEMGGATEVNTFTKIYLCFFGQYDYDAVPAIPPEIVLFPRGFGSTFSRFFCGRRPSLYRCRFGTPRNRSRRFPTNLAWTNYSLVDAISR